MSKDKKRKYVLIKNTEFGKIIQKEIDYMIKDDKNRKEGHSFLDYKRKFENFTETDIFIAHDLGRFQCLNWLLNKRLFKGKSK